MIDTTMPSAQQGPLTRARARQLNYQVKSLLTVETSYPLNGVLLNPCDDFLMLKTWDMNQIGGRATMTMDKLKMT